MGYMWANGGLDHEGCLPIYAYISNGKRHDVDVAGKVALSHGSIVHGSCVQRLRPICPLDRSFQRHQSGRLASARVAQ